MAGFESARIISPHQITPVEETIKDRQSRHGDFGDVANIAQRLKFVMTDTPNWIVQGARKREALELIATKIARILCGNHSDPDHWHDIEGYAHLISDYLKESK